MSPAEKRLLRNFALYFSIFIVIIFVGTFIFWAIEDWTFLEAVYYTFQTGTAVGTGDIAPVEDASKAFFIPYSVISVTSFFIMITTLASDVMKIKGEAF